LIVLSLRPAATISLTRRTRGWATSLLLATLLCPAAAEKAARPLDLASLGLPSFTAFTTRDGLPDTAAVTLAVDADGYVWAGTVQGLYRYDGQRWELAEVAGVSGIAPFMHLDRAGTFWAALASGGMARLDRSGWRIEGREAGLTTDHFARVPEIPDEAGRPELWALSADAGLFRRVGNRWRGDPGNAQLPPGLLQGIARTQGIGSGSRLWVATFNDGLWFRESGGAWQHFPADLIPGAQINDVLATRHRGIEELWVAGYGIGIFRVTSGGFERVVVEGAAPEAQFVYNLQAGTGPGGERTVWAATRGGVVRIRGNRAEVFDRRHGLPSNAVRDVRLWRSPDGIEVLWAATEAGIGRAVLGGTPWQPASLLGSKANGVFGVLVEPDERGGERLWVAASGDGIGLFENGRWQVFNEAEGSLPGSNARLLVRAPDESGRLVLWTSLQPGELLKVHEGPRFERVPTPWPKESGQHVMDLLSRTFGGKREIWVGTRMSGVYRYREGRWTPFDAPGVAGQWRIMKLVEQTGPGGRPWLWATTNHGLARFDGHAWTLFGVQAGLPDVSLLGLSLIPDQAGRPVLWAGSTRSGIIRIDVSDPRSPRVLPAAELPAPPHPTAYSAQRNSRGEIYIGTDAGVQQLIPDARGGYRERVFRRRDGLLNEESNANAQYVDAHGRLWVGTLGGLAVYDPNAAPSARHPKPFRLRRVRVDKHDGHPERVTVPPGTHELSFEVALLSWQREEESRFRWQLLGYDAQPGPWVPQNRHVFGQLPPGRYTLRVEARDYAGLPSRPIEVPVEVIPAWWQRLWFQLAAAAVLVLAGAGLQLLRVRRLSRQKAGLERQVAQRTSELAAANARLAQLSIQDPLTGLANRRRLDERLGEEWRRAIRQAAPLCFMLLDVDHFKAYNDTLGHPAGDACLQAVTAAVAAAHTRAGELVARYGGEEFAVLAPGLTGESALASAENTRRQVFDLGLPHPSSPVASVVTISIGLAWTWPQLGDSPADLVAAADRELYRAKQEGRDCVRAALLPVAVQQL